MKTEEQKYAELFFAMSTHYLMGKIDLERYANALNTTNEKFQKMVNEARKEVNND